MENSSDKLLAFYTKNAPFFLGAFVLALVLKNFHYPFGSVLFIISSSTLAIIYVFMGASIPRNEISASNFFKRLAFYAIAVGLMAVLFRIQHWPRADVLSLAFLFILPVLVIVVIVKNIPVQTLLRFNDIMLLLGTALLLLRYYFM